MHVLRHPPHSRRAHLSTCVAAPPGSNPLSDRVCLAPPCAPRRAMSPAAKNLRVAGSLGAFCVGAYTYTMRAVGRDDLDDAIVKREAAKAAHAAPPPPKK